MHTRPMQYLGFIGLALCLCLTFSVKADEETDQKMINDLLHTDAYQQSVAGAAQKSGVMQANPCLSGRYGLMETPSILKPLSTDSDRLINGGQWKHPILFEGCGANRTLNVITTINSDHTMKLQPILPGSTELDYSLQKTAVEKAVAAMGQQMQSCKQGYVSDTAFLKITGEPDPVSKKAPWTELWTLIYCDKKAEVTMHFVPKAKETVIAAYEIETKFTDLQK